MYTAAIMKTELEASKGTRKLDMRIDNIQLVNVFTREIYPASIGIYNERIVAVGRVETEADQVIDGAGAYAVPGLIDSHIHIETTLLTPEALGEVIIPWGTTTLCVDAMEIANVAGIDGLLAMIKDSEKLPFRLLLEIPSRVPTAPGLETTGGVLGVEEVTQLLELDETVSLGELDPSKVLGTKEEYLEKVLASLNRRKICNGHAIGLGVDDLNIYAAGHLSDDHESVYYEELLERLRLGIMPLIREGSSERNVDTLVPGIVKNNLPTDNMMFCTDDKHVNDIFKEGHISYNVKRSIELGLDPVQAIQMATINAAKHFRLEDKIGSVAPGRFADILLIDDLTTMKPKLVLKSGRIVADENGARLVPEKAYPEKLFDTVHIGADFSAEKFIIHSEGKRAKCRVIDLIKDQIINKEIFEWMDVKDGQIAADVDRDILKLAVVERYGKNGRVSTALVHGFGLKQGALAASVSHDHHNIVVVGTNDRDMAVCVEKLQELHGGFVSAVEGQVVDALALPLGGLMSTLPAKTVMKRMDEMNGAVEKMGCPMKAPFMSLSFISLPTVPELGLTDFGLIDVLGHQIIDMIVETEA